jgi:amino acid transporter
MDDFFVGISIVAFTIFVIVNISDIKKAVKKSEIVLSTVLTVLCIIIVLLDILVLMLGDK